MNHDDEPKWEKRLSRRIAMLDQEYLNAKWHIVMDSISDAKMSSRLGSDEVTLRMDCVPKH
jgi:hypothetical protein